MQVPRPSIKAKFNFSKRLIELIYMECPFTILSSIFTTFCSFSRSFGIIFRFPDMNTGFLAGWGGGGGRGRGITHMSSYEGMNDAKIHEGKRVKHVG